MEGQNPPYNEEKHGRFCIEVLMDERDNIVDNTQQARGFSRDGRSRKHMGVASSDPEYLPQTDSTGHVPPSSPTLRIRANERNGRAIPSVKGSGQPGQLHYDRYLQKPKKGRSIFTSQQDRQRRRVQVLLAVLIIAAIALALFWFFVLR